MCKRIAILIAFVFIATGLASATSTAAFATKELEVTGNSKVQGQPVLFEMLGEATNAATWSGEGRQAVLHTQGYDTEEVGGVVVNAEPVDETTWFDSWVLEGGTWRPGYQVMIGPVAGQESSVSLEILDATAQSAGDQEPRTQIERMPDVEHIQFDVDDSIRWTEADVTHMRIEGDFTISSWEADMILGDADSEAQQYRSGQSQEPHEGGEGTGEVAYTNELRLLTLTVTDGWLELEIHDSDIQHLFTDDVLVSTTGSVQALGTALNDGDETLVEGELTANDPVDFELAPSGDDRLAIEPLASTAWGFSGAPIFDDSGNPLDARRVAQLAITVADPSEGQWPVWVQAASWIGLAVVLAVTFELTGVAPLGRVRFYLATYRYDSVRARSYWKWFPATIRARMYFTAALAAAGREDHHAALEYASSIPDGSRWSKPARFIGIQSLAALGNDTAAEFALHDLSESDRRYKAMAAENPFLRHLVQ